MSAFDKNTAIEPVRIYLFTSLLQSSAFDAERTAFSIDMNTWLFLLVDCMLVFVSSYDSPLHITASVLSASLSTPTARRIREAGSALTSSRSSARASSLNISSYIMQANMSTVCAAKKIKRTGEPLIRSPTLPFSSDLLSRSLCAASLFLRKICSAKDSCHRRGSKREHDVLPDERNVDGCTGREICLFKG